MKKVTNNSQHKATKTHASPTGKPVKHDVKKIKHPSSAYKKGSAAIGTSGGNS